MTDKTPETPKKRGRRPRGTPGTPCPSCHKMCSLDTNDPEVNTLEVELHDSEVSVVTAEVRIARTSACCGDEVKETTLVLEHDATLPGDFMPHNFELIEGEDEAAQALRLAEARENHEHDLSVDEESCELTERSEGRSVYTVTYIGAELAYSITCSGCNLHESGVMQDDIRASDFEVLV